MRFPMRSTFLYQLPLLIILFLAGLDTEPVLGKVMDSKKVDIRGHVVDQNDAVIVGASIILTAAVVGRSVSASTDEDGNFAISVEPGEYELVVKAEGFSEVSRRLSIT